MASRSSRITHVGQAAEPETRSPGRRRGDGPGDGRTDAGAELSYPGGLPARDANPATVAPVAAADIRGARRGQGAAPTPAPPGPARPPPKEPAKESPTEAPKETARLPSGGRPAATLDGPRARRGRRIHGPGHRVEERPEATRSPSACSRGYKAYVVAPGAGGQVIYKVRVGVNMQRQEADKVMRRLQNEEKFKPWITR